MEEFIVAGCSSSEGAMGLKNSREEFKIQMEKNCCYDKLVKLAAVCQ